jgi:hypothetical protein
MTPDAGFAELASAIGLSASECHNAVRRLGMASLLSPGSRRPVAELLLRFLVHGVPHAFPPMIAPATVGVATAHSAPAFAGLVASDTMYVWPAAEGTARGLTLTPLFPRAAELLERNAALYELLTIVDALRVGQTRDRKAAEELLRVRLLRSSA